MLKETMTVNELKELLETVKASDIATEKRGCIVTVFKKGEREETETDKEGKTKTKRIKTLTSILSFKDRKDDGDKDTIEYKLTGTKKYNKIAVNELANNYILTTYDKMAMDNNTVPDQTEEKPLEPIANYYKILKEKGYPIQINKHEQIKPDSLTFSNGTFDTLKRQLERELINSTYSIDCYNTESITNCLYSLAKAIVYSVLKTLRERASQLTGESKTYTINRQYLKTDNGELKVKSFATVRYCKEVTRRLRGQRVRVLDINKDRVKVGVGCLHTASIERTLNNLKSSVTKDLKLLEDLMNIMELTEFAYNNDGSLVEVTDSLTKEFIEKSLKIRLGDGVDIVHEAIKTLLYEVREYRKSHFLKMGFLEDILFYTEVKNKVRHRVDEPKKITEVKTTTIIQRVYSSVRQYIDSAGTIKTACNGFVYLDMTEETEDGDKENQSNKIYLRLGKYCNLSGEVRDINGKITNITSTLEDIRRVERVVKHLKLTDKQKTVIDYRLQKKGYKKISIAMGITEDNVKCCIKDIRKKAINRDIAFFITKDKVAFNKLSHDDRHKELVDFVEDLETEEETEREKRELRQEYFDIKREEREREEKRFKDNIETLTKANQIKQTLNKYKPIINTTCSSSNLKDVLKVVQFKETLNKYKPIINTTCSSSNLKDVLKVETETDREEREEKRFKDNIERMTKLYKPYRERIIK